MAAVAETFISAIGATLTVDSVDFKIIDGTVKEITATDDFTNNGGGGWEEDVPTTKHLEFDVTLAHVKGTAPTWVVGLKYAFVLDGDAAWETDGGQYRSGNIRIISKDTPLGPKAGLKYKLSGRSQGAVVSVRP